MVLRLSHNLQSICHAPVDRQKGSMTFSMLKMFCFIEYDYLEKEETAYLKPYTGYSEYVWGLFLVRHLHSE